MSNPQPPSNPCYVCLYLPPGSADHDQTQSPQSSLVAIAQEFSPRYQRHRDDLVSIDVGGLGRLMRGRPDAREGYPSEQLRTIAAEHAEHAEHTFQQQSRSAISASSAVKRLDLDTREGSARGSSERERASEASEGGAPRAVMNGPSASGVGVELLRHPVLDTREGDGLSVSGAGVGPRAMKMLGQELRREASARGVRVHIAVAATQVAALVLAQAQPGLTIVEPGTEAAALASVPVTILEKLDNEGALRPQRAHRNSDQQPSAFAAVSAFKRWGIKTLGELAALPPADLSARLGQDGLVWRAIARGEDIRPLVPEVLEERFEASLELEWPIDGLEPLSFVLTRLLEPLSTRLERRDRGAAVLYVALRLVTREIHARRLELPSPMRDVRTLRTLALLDVESHPPSAAIDRVTIVIDPTPGRVLQHTLFTRAHPTPEQISTLLARLGALMGQDRIGAAATVDSYRPGAFDMKPFATNHDHDDHRRHPVLDTREGYGSSEQLRTITAEHAEHAEHAVHQQSPSAISASSAVERLDLDTREGDGPSASGVSGVPLRRPVLDMPERYGARASGVGVGPHAINVAPHASNNNFVSALRRCRQAVPARVAVEAGRPVRVTTDRRGFAGGAVLQSAGPWRTSGHWWARGAGEAGGAGKAGDPLRRPVLDMPERSGARASGAGVGPRAHKESWNRDEWDVALSDGGVYRIFRDWETEGWFIDAIVD